MGHFGILFYHHFISGKILSIRKDVPLMNGRDLLINVFLYNLKIYIDVSGPISLISISSVTL